ncbi:MAG: hypothetical protein LBG60_14345, partial [Bifidobacteriaceae bacterium]|nr:hypothetical protein [Bifidobacteriaceae bacterium]
MAAVTAAALVVAVLGATFAVPALRRAIWDRDTLFTKTLGGTGDDRFDAVAVTPDGGLAAAGTTSSGDGDFGPAKGEEDAVVARFRPDGKLHCTKTLGGTGYEWFGAVAAAPDGGLAAAGRTESVYGDFGSAKGGSDAVLARFGPDGDLQWSK